MAELSPAIRKLVRQYQNSFSGAELEEGLSTIHVDEVASKVAAVYEKIRGIVDWKEEHLIRRTAVERMLKRRLITKLSGFGLVPGLKAEEITEPLVSELIRGGHFPNDAIPQSRLIEVQATLEKYIYILENNPLNGLASSLKVKEKIDLFNSVLAIAACEIEGILAPPVREEALIECMTLLMEERIRLPSNVTLTSEEKHVLTSIAVRQTLFHLDAPLIAYHLLKYWYPEWKNLSPEALGGIAQNILLILGMVEEILLHPLAKKFFKVCERYDTLYLLLDDVLNALSESPEKIPAKISKPQILTNLTRAAYDKRLSTLKSRLLRMAVYSTLSILIGCAFTLFIVEVPLAKLFYGRFSLFAIAVDILAPTFLMFLLVITVRPPRKSNWEEVSAGIRRIVYRGEKKDTYEIKVPRKRGFVVNLIIKLLYALGCCLSLGTIVWLFWLSGIPPTSVAIDAINVAAIAFAGLVIRQRGRELIVEEEKTTFVSFVLDMSALPVVKLGNWCMEKWREYNIVSVFLMVLVDTPFAVFLEFVEGWSSFLKEKKEEIH